MFFYKVPGHPFVICDYGNGSGSYSVSNKVPGHPFVICDYGNGSGSYFFMVITKSNRIVINNIMYSLSIAITPLMQR